MRSLHAASWASVRPASVAGVVALSLVLGCGESRDPLAAAGARIELRLEGVPPLEADQGRYAVWLLDGGGAAHHAGDLALGADGRAEVVSPIGGFRAVEITIEPPGDSDPGPSLLRLLRGRFRGDVAQLEIVDAVTAGGQRLHEQPGQFTMFTPSDNFENGYPSHEESGIWLFNSRPRETPQNDHWVRLTPLREGWVYEGWMVRDYGQPGEIWLSYGKFLPDRFGAVSSRDDTGWGPFSGVVDFRTAGLEEYPGDDWISNPLGLPFPSELSLPLNLREKTATGEDRWTHVITVEPASDQGEPIGSERPFFIRPYRDPFGQAGPGMPRTITFHPDGVPRGTARVLP
jgi:hypothetical protein